MCLKSFFKNQKSIFLVGLVSFIFLQSLVVVAVEYAKKNQIDNYLTALSPDFKSHVDIANNHLVDISKIIFDIEVNRPEIIKIMRDASHTKDLKEQQRLRTLLLSKLQGTYSYMKKYKVRQLHFHLPNSISFLRFHRPSKFGDSLIGVRDTLAYVNEYRTPISAFEEGRVFNGFRNVYPLYIDKEFVGTAEISFSFDGMQELLSSIDSTSYLFMLNDTIVENKVFQDEKSNYKMSEFSGYVYDKKTLKDTMQIGLKEMHMINKAIAKEVNPQLKNGKLFSVHYKNKALYNNHSIVISFSPIYNLESESVAYVIHYEFGDFVDILLRNLNALFIVLTLLAVLLTTIFTVMLFNERKKQKEMHNFAVHDALTGIYNRHGINEILNQKILEHKRTKNSLGLIFFDIDFFKRVNDTYGHDMGDYVLENIAKLVSDEIRTSDIFARWGGEEFIIFLPDTGLSDTVKVAEKLRKAIEKYAFSDIDSITCSFGVTVYKEGDTKTNFLKRADKLLYKAKESGRNCVISDAVT